MGDLSALLSMTNHQQPQSSSNANPVEIRPSNLGDSKLSPPSFLSPSHPRFPPPPLLQLNQIPSPSVTVPNLLSPANGIRTTSPGPHLSTPPGPPVFTSPLQPAAVPFRTSPATPQPLAFSSGSSLPASSSPHFSNGATGLLHQISDSTEEYNHVSDSPNVLFTAHKVPSFSPRTLIFAFFSLSPG